MRKDKKSIGGGLYKRIIDTLKCNYKGRDLPQKGAYMLIFLKRFQLFADEGAVEPSGVGEVQADSQSATDIATDNVGESSGENLSEPTFEELIKGKYKEDYDKSVQSIIKRRFKGHKDLQSQADMTKPLFDMFGARYGYDTENLTPEQRQDIINKMMNENTFYEDEALERGVDVETLKEMKRAERENRQLKAEAARQQREAENRQRVDFLQQQARELQSIYPGFDLDREMENPEFERLAWRAGVPLRTAYEVVHKDEILGTGMQYAVQQTMEKASHAIQSGSMRPSESGLSSQSTSVVGQKSPRNWTKEERDEIVARVKRGERVVL